jgi:RecA/RadA recombinase
LDDALGIGGLPRGKVSEFVGARTSGKTTLALNCLAQAQSGGGMVSYVDPEHGFDPEYAHRCGLDLDRLIVGTPDDEAEALAMTEALAGSKRCAAVVLDWTGISNGRNHLPNRLGISLAHTEAVLIVLRDWDDPARHSPATHQASVRIGVRLMRWQRRAGDITGCQICVEVLKNRFARPGRRAHIALTLDA